MYSAIEMLVYGTSRVAATFPAAVALGSGFSVRADLATDRSTDARANMQHSGTAV
jgi:hypothetical protein